MERKHCQERSAGISCVKQKKARLPFSVVTCSYTWPSEDQLSLLCASGVGYTQIDDGYRRAGFLFSLEEESRNVSRAGKKHCHGKQYLDLFFSMIALEG